jgi:stage II sporulation protein D
VIGKELEIRRALSESHLYSSAFVIDTEGSAERPDAFILTGAGWGHGVGLCQIGAAVMAFRGSNHQGILKHYYPGTELVRFYA